MQHDREHGHPDPQVGYERTDANVGSVFKAGLWVLGVMIVTALLLVPGYRLLGRMEDAAQPPPAEVVKSDVSEPARSFPRLVESEPRVLAEFRAQEEALLTTYAWVEKDKDKVRIPIDEAMRIVAERGLPSFDAAPAEPAAAPARAGGAR
jgi:hypothetical protein